MNYFTRRPWDLPQRIHTPESIYRHRSCHRREFLATLGIAAAGAGSISLFGGCNRGTDEEILKAGRYDPALKTPTGLSDELADAMQAGASNASTGYYPAARNKAFSFGRAETAEAEAARYTNFYEFTTDKSSWRHVGKFQPTPWSVQVDGLCAKPRVFDMDDLNKLLSLEERHYRHRCVETWAMCVPWTGFPLADLVKLAEPQPSAKYVAFETFNRPEEAPNLSGSPSYPWPYTEGLTLAEATNELAFVVTGMYGHPLLKQHGAPIRLALPWKYGFKSIKSIVRITFTDKQPATFWNTLQSHEYAFEANVDPQVPHPRWSQRTERMLGTGEIFDTVVYNGYGNYVAKLYRA